MAGGQTKVECCSGLHLKESEFRSMDLSLALALSLRRGITCQLLPYAGVVSHGRRPQ